MHSETCTSSTERETERLNPESAENKEKREKRVIVSVVVKKNNNKADKQRALELRLAQLFSCLDSTMSEVHYD